MARMSDLLGPGNLERALGWTVLALLAIGCVLVLRPFFSSILWAIILALATWPLFARLEDALGGRRRLAAFAMTLLLALAFLAPLAWIGVTVATNVETLVERAAESFARNGPPDPERFAEPPGWLAALPLVGGMLSDLWLSLASNTEQLVQGLGGYVAPLLRGLRDLLVAGGVGIGRGLLEVSLSVLVLYFVYRDGVRLRAMLERFTERVLGTRSRQLVGVASGTIQGVVYGVVGTAALQGLLAALGFVVAGVPAPFFLGALVFLLSLFPVGAPLVWGPVAVWLFYGGEIAWGIFTVVWGAAVVSTVDNFVRPWLISRGSNLPFLLTFFGVLGGLVAFGLLGIFLGPVLLAVALALVREWLAMRPDLPTPAAAADPSRGLPKTALTGTGNHDPAAGPAPETKTPVSGRN